MSESAPPPAIEYEVAALSPGPAFASVTIRWPLLSKSKPYGALPTDGLVTGGAAYPSLSTSNVSIVLEPRSVTTSVEPPLPNLICDGTAAPADSPRVEPGSGASPSFESVKPLIVLESSFST